MRPVKIVIIGAGSTNFGVNSAASLLREPSLRGSTLALVDINPEGIDLVHRLCERINREWDAGFAIESSTDRTEVLPGAEFVACAIEVGQREELWRQDWEITLRHGVRQPYAENGGPGGMFHATRNIPHVLDIARDMERLCPNALFINLSNPLPRLCRALTKYTSITTVGLCHGIIHGYYIVGRLLTDRIGIPIPGVMQDRTASLGEEFWATFHTFIDEVVEAVDLKAAGLNHFTWMLDVRDRRTGADLYPELRARFLSETESPDPLTQDLLRLTGSLAVQGDTHVSEYVPYVHNPVTKPWQRYRLPLFDWDDAARRRNEGWDQIKRLIVDETTDINFLRHVHSEGVYEVIHGVAHDANVYRTAINVPNGGAIDDLRPETIVEVPAIVSGMGTLPLRVGSLPPVVTEWCRREAERLELVVDAAARGDRDLALQALVLDPTIDDLDLARSILDDYFESQRQYLPQFHGEWQLEPSAAEPVVVVR